MITETLLAILCCPETHQPLRLADQSLIARLNQQIATGTLKNRGGQIVQPALDEALLREDGKFVYPVRKDIPVLLFNEAIPMQC